MTSTKPVNFSSLFPDIAQSQAALARRQLIADEMSKNALQQTDVSRYAPGVKYSPMQGVSQIAQALISGMEQKDIDKQSLSLAEQSNQRLWGTSPWTNPDGAAYADQMTNGMSPTSPASTSPGTGAMMPNSAAPSMSGNGGGVMGQAFPNIPRNKLMLAMQLAPEELGKAMVNQYNPTETMRNYQQAGMSPQEIAAAIRGEATNKGTINATPGNTMLMPGGQRFVAPDFKEGIAGGFDEQGRPYAASIPGAIGAKSAMAGAVKGAEQLNTIFPSQIVNGREGVPLTGAQIVGQTPIGAPQGGLNSPQGSPVILGQTPGDKSFQEATGGIQTTILEKGYNSAQAAKDTIDNVHFARDALGGGAITGPGADWRVGLGQTAQFLGIDGQLKNAGFDFADPAKISNSVVLRSALGNQMLAKVRTLGANPTDEDRRILQDIIGSINKDPKAMGRLLDWTEKQAGEAITIHNGNVDAAVKRGFQPFTEMKVPLPKYQPGATAGTAQPKQAPDGNFYIPDPKRPGKYLQVVR